MIILYIIAGVCITLLSFQWIIWNHKQEYRWALDSVEYTIYSVSSIFIGSLWPLSLTCLIVFFIFKSISKKIEPVCSKVFTLIKEA